MGTKTSTKSIMLQYGALLGIVTVLINIAMYLSDLHVERDWRFGVAGFIAMVVIIILGINKFKSSNTYLSIGQAIKIGVGIAAISALIGLIYNAIFANFIEPEYMSQILEFERAKWLDQGLGSEEMQSQEEMFNTFSSPALGAAVGIVSSALFGLIISAIAGAIMKKSE